MGTGQGVSIYIFTQSRASEKKRRTADGVQNTLIEQSATRMECSYPHLEIKNSGYTLDTGSTSINGFYMKGWTTYYIILCNFRLKIREIDNQIMIYMFFKKAACLHNYTQMHLCINN